MSSKGLSFTVVLLSLICQLGAATGASASSEASNMVIASKDDSAMIVVSSNDEKVRNIAGICSDFFAKHGYAATDRIAGSLNKKSKIVWVLETLGDSPIAEKLNVDTLELDASRADAYLIKTWQENERSYIVVVGRNIEGLRSGIYRLITGSVEQGGKLLFEAGQKCVSPFFTNRVFHIGNTGRQFQHLYKDAQDDFMRKTIKDLDWENWDDEKIKSYMKQMRQYGFNWLELGEARAYRGTMEGNRLSRREQKVRLIMQAAHDNGLKNINFIWGQRLFKDKDVAAICWNKPEGRQIMIKEYQRIADTYGDLTDHVIVHFRDPGGCVCDVCDDYKTTHEITACINDIFKKINPDITCTLSTWANAGFWKGHPDTKEFLDESFSPKEIGIALHRWYDPEKAKLVLDSGRPLDIWVWYMGDREMHLGNHLYMHRIDQYYSALTENVGREVQFINIELSFHGLPSVINSYIGGQKMWEPHRNLEEIEKEFYAGAFGSENADAMMKLYRASEQFMHPAKFGGFIPKTDYTPKVFGLPEYNKQLDEAIKAGETVVFAKDFEPKITSVTDPADIKEYLMRNASVIKIFSEAAEKITAMKQSGADRESRQDVLNKAIEQASPYKDIFSYKSLVARVKSMI